MRQIVFIFSLLIPASGLEAQSMRFADHSDTAGLTTTGAGHGVAVADYNHDGWEDVFIAADRNGSSLFRNNRDGTFTNVSLDSGVLVDGSAVHPLWSDLNNDGLPDLFVGIRAGTAPNKIFLNNGNGTFRDISDQSGIDLAARIGAAAFGDFDLDGRIDLFLATRGGPDLLYRNVHQGGDLLFESVGNAGVAGHPGSVAMQATWIDYDHDGDLDLFAVHDGSSFPNRLYRNDGFLPLINVAAQAGIADVGSGNGMGVAWGDYDGDGWEDAYVTRIGEASLYRNRGDGTFEDVAQTSGAARNGMSWGVVSADFDNDADEDLFIVNTYSFDRSNPTFLYENTEGRFLDVAPAAGAALRFDSFGAAGGDFNNDGRLDLIMTDTDGRNRILMQDETSTGNWARFRLQGTSINRMAVGTRIRIVTGDRVQYRTVSGGDSYCSQSSPVLHVGLADAAQIDTLDVYWKPGRIERFTDIPANKLYTITEGNAINVSNESAQDFPDGFTLDQNHPNPFGTHTTIRFTLPEPAYIKLSLFDTLGRPVATLADGSYRAGRHQLDLGAGKLPGGVYIYRLQAGATVRTRKMIVIE